jgi:nitric oxide reductase subunit B
VLFTGADIQTGQEVFLKNGLMEHGSLWGHGAYLGPDYSAEYLHRLSEVTLDTITTGRYGKPLAQLSPDERSVVSARTLPANYIQNPAEQKALTAYFAWAAWAAAANRPGRSLRAASPDQHPSVKCLPHREWSSRPRHGRRR